MKIKKEYQPFIYFGLAAVAIYLLAYFTGKAKGKAKGYTRAPVDQSAITPGFDPYPVAQKVANEFQGWNFWSAGRRETLNDLWRLSDAELSLVYNEYQDNFATPNQTMTTLISQDWVFGDEVDRVINRLTLLGLP
ncbi:MAG TPA: hypothetical protein PLV43_06515 [Aequorivita sp.]|nr:hypothetical protein [Aequorivita sp.]